MRVKAWSPCYLEFPFHVCNFLRAKKVLQPMAPTIFLVDFSKKADERLCKLQYDNYLHLRYDIPVGEDRVIPNDGFVDPVLPGRAKK